MPLQDKLDAFRADFEGGRLPFKPTAAQTAIMHMSTADLIASGLAEGALKAGDTAPDFTLENIHDALLKKAAEKGWPIGVSIGVATVIMNELGIDSQGNYSAIPNL